MQAISEKVEEALVKDAALVEFFNDVQNIYPTIHIGYDKDKNAFDILITVETDGMASDEEWVQEQINDKIMDDYLMPALKDLSLDLENAEWNIEVVIKPLEDQTLLLEPQYSLVKVLAIILKLISQVKSTVVTPIFITKFPRITLLSQKINPFCFLNFINK